MTTMMTVSVGTGAITETVETPTTPTIETEEAVTKTIKIETDWT